MKRRAKAVSDKERLDVLENCLLEVGIGQDHRTWEAKKINGESFVGCGPREAIDAAIIAYRKGRRGSGK